MITCQGSPLLADALDLLPPLLRDALDHYDVTIQAVVGEQTFVQATGDRSLAGLDANDLRGVVHGAYSPLHAMIVVRIGGRDIHPPPLASVLCHESIHCLDWRKGGERTYHSDTSKELGASLTVARQTGYAISAYAKVNRRELLAETGRAALGFNATALDDLARMKRIDPNLLDYVSETYLR